MRGYYQQIEYFIRSKYPEFDLNNISGSTYPPTKFAEIIASLSNIIWLVGIALLFVGKFVFKTLGIPEPEFYKVMKENPVPTFCALFVINTVGASQLSTGAFEIKLDDVVIFSKLQTGRLPQLTDVISGLVSQGYREVAPYMEEYMQRR